MTSIRRGVAVVLAMAGLALFAAVHPPGGEASWSAGQDRPGGGATWLGPADRRVFSNPSAGMDLARRLDFEVGRALFERPWVSAPASTRAADGLGPLYNARACSDCHVNDGRGEPPAAAGEPATSTVLRLSVPPAGTAERARLSGHRARTIPEPTYGRQLQDRAIQGHAAEGRVAVDYAAVIVELADGETVQLRKPTWRVVEPAYGPLHPQAMLSARVAPQLIGLGLLEAIDAAQVLARADPHDADGDGISGRANRAWSARHGRPVLGRFGWKAGSPGLDEQSQEAFAVDIGISVPQHPDGAGECTPRQARCRQAPDGRSAEHGGFEAGAAVTGKVAFYTRHLAVPARRDPDDPQVRAGELLFHAAGCAACHTPRHVTAAVTGEPELSGQVIWPYTDLLLHDMGEGLADHRPEGEASGREWRTAPLWGIGLTPAVSGHSHYLHDGRARSLLEAILWHGGEAGAARRSVIRMSRTERRQLLRFVASL